jgi:sensor c-di-GMP phosphodiesterase-like protein
MLRRAGVHVAIDDFGTGYSSLAHLLELPADCLKIDRRFVEGIGLDPMATGLTKAILSLTESMGIGCVAEGVELQVQHDKWVEFGCPQYQGWLYAPALSCEEALTFVCREMLDYHY